MGHNYHFLHIPTIKWLIECLTSTEHSLHILNVAHIPGIQWLIKAQATGKHRSHTLNVANIPALQRLIDSNVTGMASMFANAEFFYQPLNNWNVSNVKNMVWMLKDVRTFNQQLYYLLNLKSKHLSLKQ
jgi:hypothetical protein